MPIYQAATRALPARRARRGDPGRDQQDRDRLRPQPRPVLGGRLRLDAVHARHLGRLRRRRRRRRAPRPGRPRRRDPRGRATTCTPPGRRGDWYRAIFAYNHADWYVQKVLAQADAYQGACTLTVDAVASRLGDLDFRDTSGAWGGLAASSRTRWPRSGAATAACPTSEKRERQYTDSGGISDHWVGSTRRLRGRHRLRRLHDGLPRRRGRPHRHGRSPRRSACRATPGRSERRPRRLPLPAALADRRPLRPRPHRRQAGRVGAVIARLAGRARRAGAHRARVASCRAARRRRAAVAIRDSVERGNDARARAGSSAPETSAPPTTAPGLGLDRLLERRRSTAGRAGAAAPGGAARAPLLACCPRPAGAARAPGRRAPPPPLRAPLAAALPRRRGDPRPGAAADRVLAPDDAAALVAAAAVGPAVARARAARDPRRGRQPRPAGGRLPRRARARRGARRPARSPATATAGWSPATGEPPWTRRDRAAEEAALVHHAGSRPPSATSSRSSTRSSSTMAARRRAVQRPVRADARRRPRSTASRAGCFAPRSAGSSRRASRPRAATPASAPRSPSRSSRAGSRSSTGRCSSPTCASRAPSYATARRVAGTIRGESGAENRLVERHMLRPPRALRGAASRAALGEPAAVVERAA